MLLWTGISTFVATGYEDISVMGCSYPLGSNGQTYFVVILLGPWRAKCFP
uniref:Uncharacterized protein n=1 Tax=Setaria italica TaxID=4555 RepID=K3ZPQ2_SETIT